MQSAAATADGGPAGQLSVLTEPRFVPPDETPTLPNLGLISLPAFSLPARRQRLRPRLPWWLVLALAVQVILALRLIWSNTAFEDEALYLWAGRIELDHWVHGTPIPRSIGSFPAYFSGTPVIYPPLGAAVSSFAGLAGARLLSLVFMLGATCLLYGTARKLFGSVAGASAAGVFACFGPTQFLSAFATYDPMALFLLALSAWLVTRSPRRGGELIIIAAALALGLADATKYATALWDPVVIVLAALCAESRGWWRAALRGARLTLYTAVPLAGALFLLGGKSYIRGIMFTTLMRQVGATSSALSVLGDSFSLLWALLPLAVVAVAVSFTEGRKTRCLCVILTCAMLLAPLHQAQIHTLVSLHKHVDFGAWFGAIPIGYVLARGIALCGDKGWRVAVAAVSVITFTGATLTDSLYIAGWPDMSKADATLSGLLPRTRCPCLIFANKVTEYYLFKEYSASSYGTVSGPFSFGYRNPATGRLLTGSAAYLRAIRSHYFSLVEVDPGGYPPPPIYHSVSRALKNSKGYELAATFHIPHHKNYSIEIWRYQQPAGVDYFAPHG